jgi:hypothetical protein
MDQLCIDGREATAGGICFAGLANTTAGLRHKVSGMKATVGATLCYSDGYPFLKATRDIEPGDEVCWTYGSARTTAMLRVLRVPPVSEDGTLALEMPESRDRAGEETEGSDSEGEGEAWGTWVTAPPAPALSVFPKVGRDKMKTRVRSGFAAMESIGYVDKELEEYGDVIRAGDREAYDTVCGTAIGTQVGYDLAFERWRTFLTNRDQLDRLYLWGLPIRVQKLVVVRFALSLEKEEGLRDITGTMSGVRDAFIRVGAGVEVFGDACMGRVKTHVRKSGRESSKGHLQRLPVCGQFLVFLKEEMLGILSRPMSTVAEQLRSKCTYLASVFMWNYATRFCNVGANPMTNDEHAIRLEDVEFEVGEYKLRVDEFWDFIGDQSWDPIVNRKEIIGSISVLIFSLHSSKIWKTRGRTEVLTKGAEGSEGEFFFSHLVMWIIVESGRSCLVGRYSPSDLLFASAHSKSLSSGQYEYTRKLQRSDITQAMKRAAIALGLNEKSFSAYSLRIGAISQMTGLGMEQSAIQRMCDHTEGSTSTERYQHSNGREIRPLMREVDDGLSLSDVLRLHGVGKTYTKGSTLTGHVSEEDAIDEWFRSADERVSYADEHSDGECDDDFSEWIRQEENHVGASSDIEEWIKHGGSCSDAEARVSVPVVDVNGTYTQEEVALEFLRRSMKGAYGEEWVMWGNIFDSEVSFPGVEFGSPLTWDQSQAIESYVYEHGWPGEFVEVPEVPASNIRG